MCVCVYIYVCVCILCCGSFVCVRVRVRVSVRVCVCFLYLIVTCTCLHTYAIIHAGCSTQVFIIAHANTKVLFIQFTVPFQRTELILWLSSWCGGEGSGAPPHPVHGSTWHRVSFHTNPPARHSGQTKAPADTVRKPQTKKKERKAWNNTGSLSGHIKLKRYQLHNLSNSTPPLVSHNLSPRHITVAHLHHHRDT